MGWLEWKYELDDANRAYDNGNIDRETYEIRVKMAIYMINKFGNEEAAKGIAKAHGYKLENIIKDIDKQ